ncbi:hypothetical protein [Streptomyces sp. NBC_01264]|uniref:hypothetical protein n=1 Tax=Streptomyces sp. NBC_01264 TaxID=2903804 RepID=UPI0022580E5D|nr:hypothetical protein [Streptomyces sp. NBC_01264]MCX4781739.1 hypothetical protein [Streptomyces sp. NBC_01264]
METPRKSIRTGTWLGVHTIPSGKLDAGMPASKVLVSEWGPLFLSWLLDCEQPGGRRYQDDEKVMYALTIVDRHRSQYLKVKKISEESISEDHQQKVQEFLDLYKNCDRTLTRLVARFWKALQEEIESGVDLSPLDRINKSSRTSPEQILQFHKENWAVAKGYAAQYIEIGEALTKIPEEVLNCPKPEKNFLGRSTAPRDVDFKTEQVKQFKNLEGHAKDLLKISVAHLELMNAQYRITAEGGGIDSRPIWSLDQQRLGELVPSPEFNDKLRAWYDLTTEATTQFIAAAQKLFKSCEKCLIKVATPELIKVLDDIKPFYAGAGLALRGLAGAVGVAAAVVSPIIGPASIPIGLAAAGINQGANRLERSAARQSLKKSDDLLAKGVTQRVKVSSVTKKLFKGSKGATAALEQVDKWGTQIEAWTYTQPIGDAATMAGPFVTAMDAAGTPLAGISGALGVGMTGAMYFSDKETVGRFKDKEVESGVSRLVSTVTKTRHKTHSEQALRAKGNSGRIAAMETFTKFHRNRSITVEISQNRTVTFLGASLTADLRRLRRDGHSADGRFFRFVSTNVPITLDQSYGSSVKSITWQCSADGDYEIIAVHPGVQFMIPETNPAAFRRNREEFISSGASLVDFIREGVAKEWVYLEGSAAWMANIDFGHQFDVVKTRIYSWNERMRDLSLKYAKLAVENGGDTQWTGSVQELNAIANGNDVEIAAIEPRESGMNLLQPTAERQIDRAFCLKVAFMNRTAGYADGDTNTSTWDKFIFGDYSG